LNRLAVVLFALPTLVAAGYLVPHHDDPAAERADQLVAAGQHSFRMDSFGDEAFWSGALGLHRTIAGEANGGIGPGLSPRTAAAVGLKIDVEQLDGHTRSELRHGRLDLDSPASTLALLRQNAVVGVLGTFDRHDRLTAVGVSCALCHSTVDDSFAPGIGRRRDGWPNRDLDVGAVIAFAPDLTVLATALGVDQATVRAVLHSWGPGRFDAHLLLDGQAFRPDSHTAAVLIPAAFGLGGVDRATYEGWGGIAHWNAFVGNLEMGGQGTLFDPRLDDPVKFPLAAARGAGHTHAAVDRITAKLPELQFYELSLPVPEPPSHSFDAQAAERGRQLFAGQADCARCHVAPLYAEPGFPMHTGAEIGIDEFQARRGPYDRYRTTPLRGLFAKSTGGYYHDGRFATLADVVDHYDTHFLLGLSALDKHDLVEFLKSL
jgi:hypothetical protein